MLSNKVISILAFCLFYCSQVYAKPLTPNASNSFLQVNSSRSFTTNQLKMDPSFVLAQASKGPTENSTQMVSYKYKLLIADLSALGLLAGSIFTDGMSAPFAFGTYFLGSPLIHWLEPNNNDNGKKVWQSLLYRAGIPLIGAGLGLGSLYAIGSGAGLIAAYTMGLGTVVAGVIGLYYDYKNAMKPKGTIGSTATAGLSSDPSHEVLMWQSMMSSAR